MPLLWRQRSVVAIGRDRKSTPVCAENRPQHKLELTRNCLRSGPDATGPDCLELIDQIVLEGVADQLTLIVQAHLLHQIGLV